MNWNKRYHISTENVIVQSFPSLFLKRGHNTSRVLQTNLTREKSSVLILPHVSRLKVLWRRDKRLKIFWRSFQQRVLARGRLFGAFSSTGRAITVFTFLRNWYTGRITSVLQFIDEAVGMDACSTCKPLQTFKNTR